MARSYSSTTEKRLYGKASGRCSIATCRINLILDTPPNDKDCQIGQIAHIVGYGKNGPRANATYPSNKINSYENLILLCPTCHATVDNQSSKYSVEALHEIKTNHESWVTQQLDQAIVTFAELEVAAKAIASGQHATYSDFYVITPEEKIEKNALTQETRTLILSGLSRSTEVANFLVQAAQFDSNFPEKLKYGFRTKYLELRQTASGDALFTKTRLSSFSQNV
jgi:hypothetical protein